MSSTNPDQRPLPSGWLTQYDDNYKAWFYVDTKANPPTPSWTHPLGPIPANPSHAEPHSPHKRTSFSTMSSVTSGNYGGASSEPKNPDARPLPAGWVAEYDSSYKAWFYVDTKANPPVPSWNHPLGPPTNTQQAAALPKASSPHSTNPGEPENPDKRPLPKGWTQQYEPTHKAFFYVDTTVPHPTPSWTHPLGPAPTSPTPHIGSTTSPTSASAHVKVSSPPHAVPGEPENPDKRPLPTGWIEQYDSSHKAFFYVNTAVPNPSPTWTHPGPPSHTAAPGTTSTSPYNTISSPTHSATPGQPENPDKRPLPTGWTQQYEPSHKAWFYVDTNSPTPSPTWNHPLGPTTTSPGPGPHGSSTAIHVPSNPGQPTNPDTRPLPHGWIDEYDSHHKAWFYVDTKVPNPSPTWVHPLGPPPTSPVPPTTATSGPHNPDTRALPPGWVSEYDSGRKAWFYIDTTKSPPASTWGHPLGSPPPGAPSPSSGYGPPAPAPGPTTPYGQAPQYGQPAPYGQPPYPGASSQSKNPKDQIGSLLGGFLGGKAGGKAGKYINSATGLLGGKSGHGGGHQPPPGHGPWQGQPQQQYGPPYGGPPSNQGPYRQY